MKYTYKGITIEGCDDPYWGEKNRNFNENFFGSEIDFEDPVEDWEEKDEDGCINMFPREVWYISPCFFDETNEKYSLLNSLPPALAESVGAKVAYHGKLVLDDPFDVEYVTEFDFKSVNDILAEIKLGFFKMYASGDYVNNPFGKPWHIIEVLRIERLYYNPKDGSFEVFIGT